MSSLYEYACDLEVIDLVERLDGDDVFSERMAEAFWECPVDDAWRSVTRLGVFRAVGWDGEIKISRYVKPLDLRRSTFLHEVAHAFTYFSQGVGGHGKEWISAMHALGVPADVMSDDPRFQAVADAQCKVVAVCRNCGHEVRQARWSTVDWAEDRYHTPCKLRGRFVNSPGQQAHLDLRKSRSKKG